MVTRNKRHLPSKPPPTLASLLGLLVDSGHLQVRELGILSRTSRDLRLAAHEKEIWIGLCHKKWPQTQNIPQLVFARHEQCHDGGYRWLYRQWRSDTPRQLAPKLPLAAPAIATSKGCAMYVHVMRNNVPILSCYLVKELLSPLLEKGFVAIKMGQPSILGEAQWDFDETENPQTCARGGKEKGLPVRYKDLDLRELDVSIHFDRIVDNKFEMCCVYRDKEYGELLEGIYVHPIIQPVQSVSVKSDSDLSKPKDEGYVSFGPFEFGYDCNDEGLVLRNSPKAYEIKSRFPHKLAFQFEIYHGVTEGDHFASTGFDIRAISSRDVGGTFDSSTKANKYGVTLLHILSELQDQQFW